MHLNLKTFSRLQFNWLAATNLLYLFCQSPIMDIRRLEKKINKRSREGIDAYNAVNKSISDKYGVKYYNITDISRRGLEEADLVASDGLHPSEKMYSEWVKVILSDINVVPQKDER